MSRKRSVMKPITDLWWRYCSTNRENLLCTIAAKILWSSLFDTSNVNQVLMSIYMTISNYSCQKYGTFSF
jgi:hypothetical protein